ncbi:hypothetical protein BJY00DRAFT_300870 [Aspergillus carlsbadensis]|nr:hypothetical protein BJY00DRAFT_300870 [Aspergillus carlsbadensis]
MSLSNIPLSVRDTDESSYPTALIDAVINAVAPPYGYALRRNGTCLATEEVECGNNWDNWYTCCPAGTVCGENNTCCPSDADCSAPLAEDPHCANNGTWDLYHTTKYVCCLSGKWGFYEEGLVVGSKPTGGHGCADVYPSGTDVEVLVPVATATSMLQTTPGNVTPTPDTMHTTDPTQNPPSSGSSNTGAIVGGVIGGVLALALIVALLWFFIRRRRQAKERHPIVIPGKDFDVLPAELEYTAVVRAELYGN